MDTVFETRPELRTYSSMWWSMEMLNRGQNWFETYVSHFVDWQNPKNAGLLLVFPQLPDPEFRIEVEHTRRSYQEETAIETIWSGKAQTGKPINFIAVLWPHDFDDQDPARAAAVKLVRSIPSGRGLAVSIDWQGTHRLLTTLNDLSVSWLQEEIRPRYRAENGSVAFGPVSSDAAFTYTRKQGESISTGLINGTRLAYHGRVLFQALECGMFQENATQVPGIAARFRWEGTLD
jgi:hypothetical protein